MKTNKIISIILAMCCIMSILCVVPAFAGDDSIPYSFTMKAELQKSYCSEARERTTQNPNNTWKVNMTFNEEGENTVAKYFIATSIIKTPCSDKHDIKQGSGEHYFVAYGNASNKYVKLGVMNNNDSTKKYTVSGYWDEETGVLK